MDFYTAKETINRELTVWEENASSHIQDKELMQNAQITKKTKKQENKTTNQIVG